MFNKLKRNYCLRRLRDPSYAFLCSPYVGDELVCLDLETTSLDTRSCEIISIGAVRIRNNRLLLSQKLDVRVKPQGALDPAGVRAHRLRPVDLAHGLAARDAIGQLLRFIGPRPVVGYFLEFDIAVINRLVRPWLGIRLPNRQIEVSTLYYNHMSRGRHGSNIDLSFEHILHELGLPLLPQHDALNDAVMAALMYLKLRQIDRRRGGLLAGATRPLQGSDALIRA